ncbi:MAG: hypothetical protein MI864_16845, partial [Pseudomonadales bacterium]|nr:hypothetical protein [Pseudomonadales bacterium]
MISTGNQKAQCNTDLEFYSATFDCSDQLISANANFNKTLKPLGCNSLESLFKPPFPERLKDTVCRNLQDADGRWFGILPFQPANGGEIWLQALISKNKFAPDQIEMRAIPADDQQIIRAKVAYPIQRTKPGSTLPGHYKLPNLVTGTALFLSVALTATLLVSFLPPAWAYASVFGTTLIMGALFTQHLIREPRILMKKAHSLANDPLSAYLASGKNSDTGRLYAALDIAQFQITMLQSESNERSERLDRVTTGIQSHLTELPALHKVIIEHYKN